jgi:hypothetical protein
MSRVAQRLFLRLPTLSIEAPKDVQSANNFSVLVDEDILQKVEGRQVWQPGSRSH